MADIQTIDVSALAEATDVEQTDTLLLIRQTAEGTREKAASAAVERCAQAAEKVEGFDIAVDGAEIVIKS